MRVFVREIVERCFDIDEKALAEDGVDPTDDEEVRLHFDESAWRDGAPPAHCTEVHEALDGWREVAEISRADAA